MSQTALTIDSGGVAAVSGCDGETAGGGEGVGVGVLTGEDWQFMV